MSIMQNFFSLLETEMPTKILETKNIVWCNLSSTFLLYDQNQNWKWKRIWNSLIIADVKPFYMVFKYDRSLVKPVVFKHHVKRL